NTQDVVTNNGLLQNTAAGVAVNLDAGDDIFNGAAGRTIGQVLGGIGNDTITGGVLAETLRGEGDNDTLTGNGGADTLDGGDGDDKYQLGSDATDHIVDSSG